MRGMTALITGASIASFTESYRALFICPESCHSMMDSPDEQCAVRLRKAGYAGAGNECCHTDQSDKAGTAQYLVHAASPSISAASRGEPNNGASLLPRVMFKAMSRSDASRTRLTTASITGLIAVPGRYIVAAASQSAANIRSISASVECGQKP